MNHRHSITLFMLALFFWMAVPSPAGAAATAETGKMPKAVYPETIYRFEPIMEGVELKHDFYIENHGEAPLVIQKVRPD